MADTFVRTTYPYYIRGAFLAKTEEIVMRKISYILLTYNHFSGIYLAVTTLDAEKNININTFVRLG